MSNTLNNINQTKKSIYTMTALLH